MKKTMLDLNGIKSKCFMLMVSLALLLGATSCSNEEFEDNIPDQPKELSKAELIEAALSQIFRTRANAPMPVVMATTKTTVAIQCTTTEEMTIHWGDNSTNLITKNGSHSFTHTYSDDGPHVIFLEGSNQAIKDLVVSNNDLDFLEVTNNTGLESLSCDENQLDRLDLTGCSSLKRIYATNNVLPFINITDSPQLKVLGVSNNQLTHIDLSKNPNLSALFIGTNKITDLDLSKNTALSVISLYKLPLNTINNLTISSTSFADFPRLQELDIAYTPFDSLDLSYNPLILSINISGTDITQLDISSLQIQDLYATNSKLTNLIYTSNSLLHTYAFYIEGTPFETLSSKLFSFLTALPDRSVPNQDGWIREGELYTNSLALVTPFLSYLTARNWVVNPPIPAKLTVRR